MIRRYIIELEDSCDGFRDDVERLERIYGAEEFPKGEWKLDDTEQYCYCSICEDTYYPRPLDPSFNFCPNCGADMRE